jgi:hypothetical protein
MITKWTSTKWWQNPLYVYYHFVIIFVLFESTVSAFCYHLLPLSPVNMTHFFLQQICHNFSVLLDYISPGATYQKLSLNIAHDNQTRSSRIVNDIFLSVPCKLNVFVECSLWTLTLEGIFLLLEKANSLNYHPREGVQMGQSQPADDVPSTQPR